MPKYSTSRSAGLDELFRALADGCRRAIVERLTSGPASVSEIAAPFDMALPTVVQHLQVLEQAGIVMSEKVGRVRTYQLAADALVPVNAWIVARRRPQEAQLDRLGDYLTRHPKPTARKGNPR
jgi:DNA-binding transcriptional ArsR family regulator